MTFCWLSKTHPRSPVTVFIVDHLSHELIMKTCKYLSTLFNLLLWLAEQGTEFRQFDCLIRLGDEVCYSLPHLLYILGGGGKDINFIKSFLLSWWVHVYTCQWGWWQLARGEPAMQGTERGHRLHQTLSSTASSQSPRDPLAPSWSPSPHSGYAAREA